MTIQLDDSVRVQPRARHEPARDTGLVARLANLLTQAEAKCCSAGVAGFEGVRAYQLGQRNAYRQAARLAHRYVSEHRWAVFAAFCGGLLLGWLQHLYWASLITR